MKKNLQKLGLLILVMLMVTSMTSAGFVWENKTETKGMPQGDQSKIVKTYQTEDGLRIEDPEQIIIFNFKKQFVYEVDQKNKTYTETPFSRYMKELGKDLSKEDQAKMDEFMQKIADSTTVEKTTETKKINGYNCTKYIVSIMGMNSTYWVTQDIKHYKELGKMGKKALESIKDNPRLKSAMKMFQIMDKIDGFPVLMESGFGTMHSTSLLQKFEEKKIDPSYFLPPKGYAKVEKH